MKSLSRDEWEKIQPKDLGASSCPFCNPDESEILWKGKYFFIAYNKYPYNGVKNCLLVIPYNHIKYTKDISPEEMSDFIEVEKFMSDFYEDGDYFSFIRQSMSNRSLEHLHYHYIPCKLSSSSVEDILTKQGFGK